MAQSITLKGTPKVPGATASQAVAWTGDTSYPNPAGYVITAAQLGFIRLSRVLAAVPNTAAAGAWDFNVIPTYDATGDFITSFAIHLIVQTTGVEVANAVNVALASATLYVEGN
jgi:hypothetical protein